jgi:hypothetical protein
MLIFQVLLLLIIGHFTAALLVYLNHRFVFHGELGTKGPLKFIRRYHTLHHAHPKGERVYDHIYMPMWARMMFIAIYVGISFLLGC